MKLTPRTPIAAVVGSLVLGLSSSPVRAAESQLDLKLIAEGMTAPIALVSVPDGSGRLLVADQAGVVHGLDRDGRRGDGLFLDVRSRMVALNAGMEERGISGFALHPKFRSNHRVYVVYNAPLRPGGTAGWDNTMRVSEFTTLGGDDSRANPDSERVVLEIDKPDLNHNSGRIAFGPDGYLYVTVGDGGAPNDVGVRGHAPEGNGQNLQTLLGKILRIDVDHGTPHGIPKDNPFADGKQGRPEIYAYGLRNPWGLSFDRGGGHGLVVSDVGQDRWEELNVIVKGGNYGWRAKEGFDAFDPNHPNDPPASVPRTGPDGKPFVDPVLAYRTARGAKATPGSFGVSITGGYVYRGKAIPRMVGKYVFGDWSSNMAFPDGRLLVATPTHDGTQWPVERLALKGNPDGKVKAYLWAMGEDEAGELYVLSNGANMVNGTRGKVHKLVAE